MLFLFKINSVAEIGTEERKGWGAAILIGLSDFFLKVFWGYISWFTLKVGNATSFRFQCDSEGQFPRN